MSHVIDECVTSHMHKSCHIRDMNIEKKELYYSCGENKRTIDIMWHTHLESEASNWGLSVSLGLGLGLGSSLGLGCGGGVAQHLMWRSDLGS